MAEIIQGTAGMAKGLTIAAMAIAALMLVLFGLNMASGIPFGSHGILVDACFLVVSLGI